MQRAGPFAGSIEKTRFGVSELKRGMQKKLCGGFTQWLPWLRRNTHSKGIHGTGGIFDL
jgi:hypothetical protein